jgi:adenylate cyclase
MPHEASEGAGGFDCFNHLSTGVLVCEADSLAIQFANSRAQAWFGGAVSGQTLDRAIPGLELGEVRKRLDKGRAYTMTGEVAPKAGQPVPYRLTIRPGGMDADNLMLVEIADITKEKEQKYLLESYSGLIERKNREIEKEQERAERLLMNVFPLKVLQEFKEFGTTTPSFYDEVSVLFLDFVAFTKMPVSKQPKELIAELNDIFSTFDQITEHHCCERIKTIGDAYLAVSNMPSSNPDHAVDITNAATKMIRYLQRRNGTHPIQWICRIGIHTGSVVGSVVGIRKYIYDVFGDGVNTACRIQSLAEPMRIAVSERTQELIRGSIACRPRGELETKGADRLKVYFVEAGEGGPGGTA